MPHLTTDDGVNLYYEEVGGGIPINAANQFYQFSPLSAA